MPRAHGEDREALPLKAATETMVSASVGVKVRNDGVAGLGTKNRDVRETDGLPFPPPPNLAYTHPAYALLVVRGRRGCWPTV